MSLPALTFFGFLSLTLAGPNDVATVEDWTRYPPGREGVPGKWSTYGAASSAGRQSAVVVNDEGRPALHLKTENSSIRLGLQVEIDLAKTPWLQWAWKPVTLPRHGDVRGPINDQVARVFVIFGPAVRARGIGYIWDTVAPPGSERAKKSLLLDRRLIVVRSGADGLGRWHTEMRNVSEDYVRLFGTRPGHVRGIGIESHSEDAAHASEVLIGRLQFTRQP